ncbi:MAG TPA: hypothetical protein VGF94_13400 [Kofleriaceae bacterium]|jgi:hypothetical protein
METSEQILKRASDVLAELRDEVRTEKATAAFMKHAEASTRRAASMWETAREASGKTVCEFSVTDGGIGLQKLYTDSRMLLLEGPGEEIAKSGAAVLLALDAAMAAQVETFGLAHNLDAGAARARLEEISPSFADLVRKHRDVHDARRAAVEKAKVLAAEYRATRETQADRAATRAAADDALARKRALMTPSEAQFMAKAEALAIEKGIATSAAVLQLSTTSPEGIRLAAAAKRERELRMAGAR